MTVPTIRSAVVGSAAVAEPRLSCCQMVFAAIVLTAALVSPATAAEPPALPVLNLIGRDHIRGQLVDVPDGKHLLWQSPVFSAPLAFAPSAINAIHFPVPAKLPVTEGELSFELIGGDELYGKLVSLNDSTAVLEIAGMGTLHVDRSMLRRISRWKDGGDLIYFGPTGLKGWQQSGEPNAWHEEAGHLLTSQAGASIRREFGAPAKARFEIELSWKGKPDFEFSLGVDPEAKTALRAFHLAVWDDDIIAARETEREADVASLMKTKDADGHLHVIVYLDQSRGQMLVYSSLGVPLGEITAEMGKVETFGGVQLANKTGDVRLERLHIGKWDGNPPRSAEGNKSRVHLTSGAISYGNILRYDAEQRQYTVDDSGTERTFAQADVQDVHFTPPETVPERTLRAIALNGVSLSGELVKIEQQTVWLKHPGIQEPVSLPIASLQSLISLAPAAPTPQPGGRQGRLEADGLVLSGTLVDATEGDTSCLVWQPVSGLQPAPLRRDVAARIIYRDPPPPVKAQVVNRNQVQVRQVRPAPGFVNQLANLFGGNGQAVAPPPGAMAAAGNAFVLHLRSGDTVPCSAANIDERGVTYKSTVSDATFIPHSQLKVLELMPKIGAGQIAKSKKERLLMLPRMQRDSPPTHLLRSTEGDYLRGRVVSMNDKEIEVEVRLETRVIPRNQVARLIWLHADEMDGATAALPEGDALGGTRVQSLPMDGNRLTFFAEQLDGLTLSGKSPLLGACRIDLLQVDQLVIGAAIEQSAASLAFHQWKLRNAPDPLETPDGDGGSGSEGLESILVGKPAPEFELDLLTGGKFRLAEEKGKIIVLDFWASWCGPCLQAMPQVDRVATEYADRGVKLVAVNLEETPAKVQAALDRLKLETAVALDRNGRIAEKYGATAIPQTVIIDRDGVVARLFVGGGARFDDQLRAALDSVLAGTSPKSE